MSHRSLRALFAAAALVACQAGAQQQTINIGSAPNAGDGDPARTAFTKVNDNFTELYDDLWDALVACAPGQLIFNLGDQVGCNSNLTWDNDTQTLTMTGLGGDLGFNPRILLRSTGADANLRVWGLENVSGGGGSSQLLISTYLDDGTLNEIYFSLDANGAMVASKPIVFDAQADFADVQIAGTCTGCTPFTYGTFEAQWETACDTTPSQTINFATDGEVVILQPIDDVTCTGDSANFLATGALPMALRPASTRVSGHIMQAVDDSNETGACLLIEADGDLQLVDVGTTENWCDDVSTTNWASSNGRSWGAIGSGSITYMISDTI